MKAHPLFPFRYQLFAVSVLAIFSLAASASALVMRPGYGPEPVIVQIKESLRLSSNLDNSLSALAQLEEGAGVGVQKWWVGPKLLQLVSFPKDFSEEQALDAIETLQQSATVEKVVPVSAFNLEFKPGDFIVTYEQQQDIPEAALRGLSTEQASCPLAIECDVAAVVNLPHVPNQIIIGWKPQYAWNADQTGFRQDINQFHQSVGAQVVQEMTPTPTDLIQVIEFNDPGTQLEDKLKEYARSPWVEYAQPNYLHEDYAIEPNDTYYTNPGQPYLSKIRAPQAWNLETGSSSVIVAVADSGANVDHPDFRNRLSPGARNFFNNSNDVSDMDWFSWHGSHVASIIGAQGNNGNGPCPGQAPILISPSDDCGYMAGVAWDIRLLILKRNSSSSHTVAAIDYAYSSNQGHAPAIAINCSYGLGPLPMNCIDRAVTQAIRRARSNNMVIVAAAGNGVDGQGFDMDQPQNLVTPASVPTDNVIAVGATRVRPDLPLRDDTKTDFSNYGKYRVELGAPGGEDGAQDGETYGIIGLTALPYDPDYAYIKSSGTSFSAPQVAGALALVKSKYSWEDYAGILDRVRMGVDEVAALHPDIPSGGFRTGGRLNLEKALKPRTLIKNLSTRAKVESDDRIIIGGFVIGGGHCPGNTPCEGLKVVIRGLGPTLPPELSRLPDPKLRLNNSNGVAIFANNNWQDNPAQAAELTALGLAPGDSHEAAMVQTLQPGSYTVFLESQDGQEGIALFEIYEIRGTTSEKTRLVNLSTRCVVGSGHNVAIAGTILQNPDQAVQQSSSGFPRRRILSFGRGPSLQRFGLSPTLPDPRLEFHGSSGLIVSNNQWKDIDSTSTGLEDKLVESKFMPCSAAPEQYLNESVVWPTLHTGAYTAILSDAGSGSGIALIEFYEY